VVWKVVWRIEIVRLVETEDCQRRDNLHPVSLHGYDVPPYKHN